MRQRSDSSASAADGQPGKRKRQTRAPRGLTCSNCRARKTRCDGGQPGCKTCEIYKDVCRYERVPPMSHVRDLARRLQEAEEVIKGLSASGTSDSTVPTIHTPSGGAGNTTLEPVGSESAIANTTSANPLQVNRPEPDIEPYSTSESPNEPAYTGMNVMLDPASPQELTVDADGRLHNHGATSSFHHLAHSPPPDRVESAISDKQTVRALLSRNARDARNWEDLAQANAALRSNIPQHTLTRLLQLHWTWIAPMFMWVYRPAFIRDMSSEGPYYSEFLLVSLCAHAARFQGDSAIRDILSTRANLLLGPELVKGSAVPTAQAMLQLSARELAFGHSSQAWLYSGIAFRMVSDMGLHFNHGSIVSLGKLNSEDLEVRRRLFWSCYFWDKTESLYMGRMPVLTETPFGHEPELLDDSSEYDLWPPQANTTIDSLSSYIPKHSHAPSCFENSCKLAVIINDIIHRLYNRRQKPSDDDSLRDIHRRLEHWRKYSPSHLRYEPANLPNQSPPPHILTQNMLYYTTLILLHRPFHSAAAHQASCRQAAYSIEQLLRLLTRTFGLDHITYLQAYCIYTAASVLLRDVHAGDSTARAGIDALMNALRGGIKTCPILEKSLDILERALKRRTASRSYNAQASTSTQASRPISHMRTSVDPVTYVDATPSSFDLAGMSHSAESVSAWGDFDGNVIWTHDQTDLSLPAFPFFAAGLPAAGASLGQPEMDMFSMLDNFPENNITLAQGDWLTSFLQEESM